MRKTVEKDITSKPKRHNIELKGLAVCKTLHLSRHCRIQHILTFYASFYYSN